MVFPVVTYGWESWTIKKESWAPRNRCFWTVVLEKTLASPLDCEELQPVHPKGNQSWIFTGKTDAEVETPILWPPDAKNWLTWKDWERLKAGGKGDDRGWDGWMASPTQCTWVWVNSGSWWWTGRPGVLQSMGSQSRTRLSDWTELNWASSNPSSLRGQYKDSSRALWCGRERSGSLSPGKLIKMRILQLTRDPMRTGVGGEPRKLNF